MPPGEATPAATSPAEIMRVRLLIEPPVAAPAAGETRGADNLLGDR